MFYIEVEVLRAGGFGDYEGGGVEVLGLRLHGFYEVIPWLLFSPPVFLCNADRCACSR